MEKSYKRINTITSRIELKLKLLHIFPNILIYIIELLKIFNKGKILNI